MIVGARHRVNDVSSITATRFAVVNRCALRYRTTLATCTAIIYIDVTCKTRSENRALFAHNAELLAARNGQIWQQLIAATTFLSGKLTIYG
jgi:hypothetical protein